MLVWMSFVKLALLYLTKVEPKMGAFNRLIFQRKDPISGQSSYLAVQFKYGNKWQYDYKVGGKLRWGGNDEGRPGAGRVVVDAVLEEDNEGFPEDWIVFIERDVITGVEPHHGQYDFVRFQDTYFVLEE